MATCGDGFRYSDGKGLKQFVKRPGSTCWSMFYATAMAVSLHGKLISRRYRPMSPQERAEVSAAIDVIRKTEVPMRSVE